MSRNLPAVPPPERRDGDGRFTLVELLIVIVVLGILSGIAVFGVARFRADAGAAACRADLATVTRAATLYQASTGDWPADIAALVDGDYLKDAPSGTYRFDAAARSTTRDPACPTAAGAGGAVTGVGGKCMAVAGGSAVDGSAVQLATCSGGDGQRWVLRPAGRGPITALGKCLTATGGGTANSTALQLSTCDSSGGQQWLASDGSLRNPQSGRCLDAEGASTADGTRLILFDCHGGSNQRWVLP